MGDVLEKIFAVILIVILMFFFPLIDSFERMDDLSYMTVYSATVKFVDSVRNTGHITPQMYSEFVQMINATGNTYVVEMVHRQENYYPIGTDQAEKLYDENYDTMSDIWTINDNTKMGQLAYKIKKIAANPTQAKNQRTLS